jgi:hypothetical protein
MKYNRDIDEQRIQESKARTMQYVLDHIEEKRSIRSIFTQVRFKFVLSAMSLLLIAIIGVSLFIDQPTPPAVQTISVVQLSQDEQQKLVETSYISGNIILHSLQPSLEAMAYREMSTKFNDRSEEFDDYFQMLKPFIDEVDFSDFQVTELIDQTYDYQIIYNVDGSNYVFNLSMDETSIIGEMIVRGITLAVEGKIEKDDTSLEIEILAQTATDYIRISYESEIESDETSKEYIIEESINGLYKERTIEINRENDEVKVEMTENGNYYELTKEIGDQVIYHLEYEIDGVEGEGSIQEINNNGTIIYRYDIEEDGIEESYEYEDEYEDDEDDEDEDDEEDDEDEIDEDEDDEEDDEDEIDEDEDDEEDDEDEIDEDEDDEDLEDEIEDEKETEDEEETEKSEEETEESEEETEIEDEVNDEKETEEIDEEETEDEDTEETEDEEITEEIDD